MVLEDQLSLEHRSAARDLWEALYNSPTREGMEEARARLVIEADAVRSAILRAAAIQWREGVFSEPQENPFK